MKQVALIFLIGIYSMATLGLGVNKNYCCGKLTSITLSFSSLTNNKTKNPNEKKGCCDNALHFFKVKDEHTAYIQTHTPVKQLTEIDTKRSVSNLSSLTYQYSPGYILINFIPKRSIPIYIYNCVFRV